MRTRTIKPCPRCGVERQLNESRHAWLCADCKVTEPNWPHVHIPNPPRPTPRWPANEASDVIRALLAIAIETAAAAQRRTTLCSDCGCLILTGEDCPNCQLQALTITNPDLAKLHQRHAA